MAAPFAFDPSVPGAVDLATAQQGAANFLNTPAAPPPDPGLPGPGSILPPFTASSADLAAGLMARQPNAVVAVPPQPMAAPPAPGLPQAAPVPAGVPPVAVPTQGGGGGTTGGRARGPGPDNLEQKVIKAGQDEQAGVEKLQEAKAEGSDALANVYGDIHVQSQAMAQEQADEAEKRRVASEHMDATELENIKKARDYTIPDFWAGKEGARVGSILSVALGGVAAAITGGPNGALQIINKNVDDYFHKQKEKVDNLYKYAEQTGRLNDKTRMRYAQELTNLQAQHTAVLKSAMLRIDEVAAKNQGHVDLASIDQMKAKLGQQIVEDQEKARANQASISLSKAHEAQAYAAAAESRQDAATKKAKAAGEAPQDEKLAVRDPATGQVVGYSPTARQTQTIAGQLNAGRMYVKALEDLKADVAKGGHILNPLSDEAKRREQIFNDAVAKGRAARGLGVSNANLALEHGAFGGPGIGIHKTVTPEVLNNMIRDATDKTQGIVRTLTPVRGGGPNPLLQSAPAKPNTVVRMKDGSVAEFDASGKRVK